MAVSSQKFCKAQSPTKNLQVLSRFTVIHNVVVPLYFLHAAISNNYKCILRIK